jgi:hypothetical protein
MNKDRVRSGPALAAFLFEVLKERSWKKVIAGNPQARSLAEST